MRANISQAGCFQASFNFIVKLKEKDMQISWDFFYLVYSFSIKHGNKPRL